MENPCDCKGALEGHPVWCREHHYQDVERARAEGVQEGLEMAAEIVQTYFSTEARTIAARLDAECRKRNEVEK